MVAGGASRHAVVTGGAKGIGLAIARRLAREGFALSLLARDEAALAAAGEELGAFTARCDVRSDDDVGQAFEAAAEANGPLGRMGRPEHVAGTVAWLVSPDACGVTGQAIDQNGGAFMS